MRITGFSGSYDLEDGTDKEPYPKSIFFILGNEFCERFSYYGMRTILTIYLTEELLYGDSQATLIFHAFIMLSYFTPLFGALLADSYLGKFKTILYISIVYAIGNIILSVGSIPNTLSIMKGVTLLGLLIIGIGTGGIKPCVSAFGGDQFSNKQEKERQKFFSIFYFAINSGSVISTLLTPILRADVHCFGSDSCYPLAYGVPAVLMVVSLILFVGGKPLYKIRKSEGNIFSSVFKCISHALSRKTKSKDKKREHWLDYADDKYDKTLITDIKTLLHVLTIFLPLPVFWALFDQTGSSWTLQATKMDREVLGYYIKPDQMQVMNALLIIILIPIFDYAVYPLFNKCNLLKKPLQRIAVGGFLSALAFVVTGLVELKLESGFPIFPENGLTDLNIINNSPCRIRIEIPEHSEVNLNAFQETSIDDLPFGKEATWKVYPTNCTISQSVVQQFNAPTTIESMMITQQGGKLEIIQSKDTKARSEDGEPKFRIFYSTDYDFFPTTNSSFKLDDKKFQFMNRSDELAKFGVTDYYKIEPGKYNMYFPINETDYQNDPLSEIELKSGGIYIATIYHNIADNFTSYEMFMFAALMGLDMMGFSIMAYFYKYVGSESEKDSKASPSKSTGKENNAYEEETDFNK
ncbi:hypothetical protein JTE90_013692 [Oedothorax gibbosus]|uniref:Oligopeptide transporter 1 n=1 Tax=Oedothorax gibbosus TaxID=931172 RepID=A0AAV6UH75_9ARAC|nr:hypothetical protein JTE90_013692 [Oedothorax gibbosus]